MLLTEFDPTPRAVINPDYIKPVENFPETVVAVFSHQLFASVTAFLDGKRIAHTRDADGDWPIYEVTYRGKQLGFCKAKVGAPACVGQFEEIIAMGARRFILLGNCGVLDKRIEDCGIIIPTKAIRDEGTSYHYAPASDLIDVNTRYIPEFIEVLREFGYPYAQGAAWTTDAFYRETPQRLPPGGAWARCAWKWSARPCRPCAISGAWNSFSISMPGTIWITPSGTPEACPDTPGYQTRKKLPCWLSSWPAESAE